MPIRHSRSARLAAAVSSALAAPLGFGAAAVLASVAIVAPAHAQETTTQINGVVQTPEGQPIPDATVTITHVPSGTSRSTTANADGRFSASGLRPGGPYRVVVGGAGYQERTFDDVYTQLGQPVALNALLSATEVLADISVSATREAQLVDLGVGTQFGSRELETTASFSRDIKDLVRLDPKVTLDPANFNAISVAGASNRFNSLTIDGVRQNDDFGLNNNGYPTTRSPVSLDAVEAIAVQTAPYSVEYSGFSGGTINIVTKSGTNDFHGSVYGFYNSDAFAGNETKDRKLTLNFEEKNYGATFRGPIIKDKLFFALSYEQIDQVAPVTTGAAGGGFANPVNDVPLASYQQVVDIARNVYGFDPGETPTELDEEDKKAIAKIDWQINDDHRATFQYQYNDGNTVVQNNSSAAGRTVGTPSNWYNRPIEQNVYTVQLFSNWTPAFSTEFKAGRKQTETGQIPLKGLGISELIVCTSGAINTGGNGCTGGAVFVGPDQFRHANELKNDLDTYKLKGTYLLGNHAFTAGVEYEKLDIFNLFVATSRGQYLFPSIAAFQARNAGVFNYQNAFTNVAADGAAEFAYSNTSVYLQDRWEATPDLTLTYGVRHEWWSSDDLPNLNQGFLTRYGFDNRESLDGRKLTLPRFGFNWRINERTTAKGGIGLFGGGGPNVWISNSYSQDGVTVTSQQIRRPTTGTPTALQAILDNVQPGTIPTVVQNAQNLLRGNGSVNAIDPNFKIPSSWKYSFGIDRFQNLGWLGDDWLFRTELVYSDVKNAVVWRDLRLVQTGTAPDGRPIYGYRATDPSSGTGSRPVSVNDLLLTNTSKGSSFVATFDVQKTWDTVAGSFDGYLGYTFTDAEEVNPGTSSTALSNWDNVPVADPNNPTLATSNYETRHRFVMTLNWRKAFFGDYQTTAGLFVERRSGQPFSYTFGNGTSVFGDPRQGARQRQLLYVPKDINDYEVAGGLTKEAFEAFIDANGLGKYRGQIAPRNGFNSPWWTSADLRISQEIPGLFPKGAKGVITFDIVNVANLINKDWGQFRQVAFPYVAPVVNAAINPATGKYVYSPIANTAGNLPRTPNYDLRVPSVSVWRMNLGFRYQF